MKNTILAKPILRAAMSALFGVLITVSAQSASLYLDEFGEWNDPIWSTNINGTDSVNWTSGSDAELGTVNLSGSGSLTTSSDQTVASIVKITTGGNFTLASTGDRTITNTSGVYDVAGGVLSIGFSELAGNSTLTKTGGAALALTRNIAYTATAFDIQAGELRWVADEANFNPGTSINIGTSSVFRLNTRTLASESYEISALTGSGEFLAPTDNKGLEINIATGDSYTFSGAINDISTANAFAVVKTGAGTQTLAGINTYAGDTTITAGTLILAASSETRFRLENGNTSNEVTGSGTVAFNGLFRLDITGLTDTSGTWLLVNPSGLSESFNLATFNLAFVGGPTFTNQGGGVFTSDGWTFDTGTGTLQLVPEPSVSMLVGIGLCALVLFPSRTRSAKQHASR